MKHSHRFGFCAVGVLIVGLAACQAQSGVSKPNVAIAAPPHGSTFTTGEVVAVQSAVADSSGISRVELYVDGSLVKQDTPPVSPPPAQFNLIQNWTANGEGQHILVVRAFNTANVSGESGININVNALAAQAPKNSTAPTAGIPTAPTAEIATAPPSPTHTPVVNVASVTIIETATPSQTSPPTDTPLPSATVCLPDASFVADVTIPDHTIILPGAPFLKTWRVQNNGNCAWGNGYQLIFAGGEQMGAPASSLVPAIVSGGTVDLTLSMVAPAASGTHQSNWRLRTPSGQIFGANLTVVVDVPLPTASPTQLPTASPTQLPTKQSVGNLPPLEGNFRVFVDFNDGCSQCVLSFGADAGDIDAPCHGDNGCNIDHVDLMILDSHRHVVYQRTEHTRQYCGFGGGDHGSDNDPQCNQFRFQRGDRWPNNGPEIAPGDYTLHAVAYSRDGRKHVFNSDEDATITIAF